MACSIPVFRYALERWRPDPYEVLVFHRGALSDEQQTLVQQLSPEYEPGEPIPNATVSIVDLDGEVRPEFAAIWEAQGEAESTAPQIVVRTPWRGENETVWSGSLSAESIQTVLQSPLRAELVQRLAGGESVVWVLLEGDDAAENERLAAETTKLLQQLQGGIALPEILQEDLGHLSVRPDQLGLKFSLVRMQRDDPHEELLLRSLLTVKRGLDAPELNGEPMLFPVFGRCRVYFPLVGRAIEPANLEDLARFLSGACQCTIKQQNPGVDLLTTVDWDAYVLGIETEKPLPPLAGLGRFVGDGDSENADTVELAAISSDTSGERPAEQPESSPAVAAPPTDAPAPSAESITGTADQGSPAGARTLPVERSPDVTTGSIGSQVLWLIGLVTAVIAVASLWLLPRRPM